MKRINHPIPTHKEWHRWGIIWKTSEGTSQEVQGLLPTIKVSPIYWARNIGGSKVGVFLYNWREYTPKHFKTAEFLKYILKNNGIAKKTDLQREFWYVENSLKDIIGKCKIFLKKHEIPIIVQSRKTEVWAWEEC